MPGTRLIGGRALKQLYTRLGRKAALQHLQEALDQRHLSPSDFSIRELFESFIEDGRDILRPGKSATSLADLMEAGDGSSAVGYSDFSNITGQIFFTEIKQAYTAEEFVFTKEVTSKASEIQDIEKIPGISQIGVAGYGAGGPGSENTNPYAGFVNEGAEYMRYGVSEDYQEVSYKRKKGGIVEVTIEAVRGDRTGLLLERCGKLGYFLGIDKEMRIIDAIIDQNAGATSAYNGGHQYTWKGTAYATYQSSTPWINVKTSNAFLDETSIDSAWQVQAKITDPYTGLPILVMPSALIVAPQLVFKAQRSLMAQEIRQMDPGYATSGDPVQQVSPPALPKVIPNLRVLSSRLLYSRMNTASETTSDWFLANLKEGIHHYYNWDILTSQRSKGTDAEFERDIVMQFKATIKDTVAVFEPRVMFRNSA